jgi:hypothetical protein
MQLQDGITTRFDPALAGRGSSSLNPRAAASNGLHYSMDEYRRLSA